MCQIYLKRLDGKLYSILKQSLNIPRVFQVVSSILYLRMTEGQAMCCFTKRYLKLDLLWDMSLNGVNPYFYLFIYFH